MFAIVQNGQIVQLIAPGTAFELDGVSYPANWCNLSTPEEKAAIGMVDVVYGPAPSDQYYWVSQDAPYYDARTNEVYINFTATPKDLAELQSQQVTATNQAAYNILQPSDWMVVRATETGTDPVPADWNTWRQAIRVQAADQNAAINACTTVEQLAALPSVNWLPSPDQPVTGTN